MEMRNLDERVWRHFILPKAAEILLFGVNHEEETKLSLPKQCLSFILFSY